MRSVVIFCSVVAAVSAYAQSSDQLRAVKHLATAQWMAQRCSSIDVNWRRLGLLMAAANIEPRDIEPEGRLGQHHRDFLRDARASMSGLSESAICLRSHDMYGSKGQLVPTLIENK